jgi:hypothetical protein
MLKIRSTESDILLSQAYNMLCVMREDATNRSFMKGIDYIISLQTNSPTKKLSFSTMYLVQINFTFDLTVISDKFSGTSHFCVRKDEIQTLCNDLTEMYSKLSGSSKLSDNDSDGFVEFVMFENGHLQVNGQIGGSHEDHFMKFLFVTDQTCIPQFVDDFKKLLNKLTTRK